MYCSFVNGNLMLQRQQRCCLALSSWQCLSALMIQRACCPYRFCNINFSNGYSHGAQLLPEFIILMMILSILAQMHQMIRTWGDLNQNITTENANKYFQSAVGIQFCKATRQSVPQCPDSRQVSGRKPLSATTSYAGVDLIRRNLKPEGRCNKQLACLGNRALLRSVCLTDWVHERSASY